MLIENAVDDGYDDEDEDDDYDDDDDDVDDDDEFSGFLLNQATSCAV